MLEEEEKEPYPVEWKEEFKFYKPLNKYMKALKKWLDTTLLHTKPEKTDYP